MYKRILPVSFALLAALFTFLCTSGLASAHGHRMVGPYTFIVGFLDEPAYAGLKNGLDLTICKGDCQYTITDGTKVVANPVANADKTLKAEVTMGAAAPLPLTLTARYGLPGKYAGYFMPSKAGDYTFHISGTLEGNKIDEKFVSSKDGFNGVETISQYPAGQASTDSSSADITALQNQVTSLQNSLNIATIIGIVVGVLSLALATFALIRKPHLALEREEKTPVDSLRG